MNPLAQTLWDLLRGAKPQAVKRRVTSDKPTVRARPMQEKYDALVEEMKRTYSLRVRKWRNSSSGCAWVVRYSNGSEQRLIESPYPRGPMSCAIFLHEVGHHAIGFGRHSPRCLEEYHAWQWGLNAMQQRGLNITDAVRRRMTKSLQYAVAKAKRRGLKRLPAVLASYS